MNFPRSAFARAATVVILATFAALLPQLATAQNNRLAGTWKLLPDKSTFTPGPARYRSMTLTIPDSGDPVMNVEGVDAQGRPVKGSYTAVPDGRPHPISGIPAFDSGTWTRQNDSVVSYQYSKGRGIAALGTRALSPDGSTLTFREQIYDDKGKQTGTAVMVFLNPDVKVASATPPPEAPPPPPKPVFTPQETAALAVLDKNDNDDAIRQFTAIIDAKPPSPMLYYDYGSRGIAYLRKGQQDQALADFDAAIKLKADDGDSHFRRGAIKFGQMQYQAAIDDLSVAVQADPMNADAFNMRSFSYYRLQQTEKGAADTEKACALKKEYCIN